MGRQAIPVSASELQAAVQQCEANGPLRSRSALWEAVAATEWARKIGLQPQVAMLRAKEYDVKCATPKGQRGRAPGQGMPAGCTPSARQEGTHRRKLRLPLTLVADFKARYPEWMHKTIDKAARGSRQAADKIHCLDCVGLSKAEVKNCTDTACAKWGFRPYQNARLEQS
jgi:hypothetical protein